MIQQSIDLDIIPGQEIPVIHVNQDDTGTSRLQFRLIHEGQPYYPQAGTIKIQGRAVSGFEHTCSRSGSLVTVSLYADMTDRSGDVVCNLVIIEGDSRHGTQNFILRVQEGAS